MLPAITALLICQLAGETAVRALGLPVPGPVLGLVLLLGVLVWRGGVPDALAQVADRLLENLSLLFVPAGVGVIVYLGLIAHEWFAIVMALIGSTALGLVVTALVLRALLPQATDDAEPRPDRTEGKP